jgi:hypothetical protein
MKKIDLGYQTVLAELGQRSMDAEWTADSPRTLSKSHREGEGLLVF